MKILKRLFGIKSQTNLKPPASWTKEMQTYFPKLPAELQTMLLAHERKVNIGLRKKAAQRKGEEQ